MSENPPWSSEKICAVVLAGGRSRRMGKNKALIPFKGQTLISQVTGRLSSLFPEVIIVCDALSLTKKTYADPAFRVLCDQTEGLGPIGGIETALKALPGKTLFVVAADMPFLKSSIIKEMCSHLQSYDLVIPKLEGKLHPLHAFYAPTCLPKVNAAIRSKNLALHLLSTQVRTYFFPEKRFRKLDPTLSSVFNVNTPEDLAKASTFSEQRSSPKEPES